MQHLRDLSDPSRDAVWAAIPTSTTRERERSEVDAPETGEAQEPRRTASSETNRWLSYFSKRQRF